MEHAHGRARRATENEFRSNPTIDTIGKLWDTFKECWRATNTREIVWKDIMGLPAFWAAVVAARGERVEHRLS